MAHTAPVLQKMWLWDRTSPAEVPAHPGTAPGKAPHRGAPHGTAPSVPLDSRAGHLPMARACPADSSVLPSLPQNLALGLFSLLKIMDFTSLKMLLSFHLSACRAGVPTLRPSRWARLSGQNVLPAEDIP